MIRRDLTDASGTFEVTVLEAAAPRGLVLFSVGAGGSPERHLPLLTALSIGGFTVIAPHFERLTAPRVSDDQLILRAERLRLALDIGDTHAPVVVGVGHSIGATALLAMAGAEVWMGPGRPLEIARDDRLRKLALLAPATGFFQAPGALDAVRVPIAAWVGTKDTITPPAQADVLVKSLTGRVAVDVRVEDGAGHFSFMHVPPPHAIEPLSNRDEFLARVTAGIVEFAAA